jgi:hypothetical protein
VGQLIPADPVHLFCQRLKALTATGLESSASSSTIPRQARPNEDLRSSAEAHVLRTATKEDQSR